MNTSDPNNNPLAPPPGLWNSWSRAGILGLFFMALTGNFFIQFVVYRAIGGLFLPVMAGGVLGVLLPLWLLARVQGLSLSRDFFLDRPHWMVLLASGLMAVTTLVPTSLLAELSLRLTPANPEAMAFMNDHLPSTGPQLALAFLGVAVIAPLAEEIIFRGLLHRLASGLWGPLAATAVSSLVFGILHGEAWLLFGLVGVGVVLAFVFETTGSVTACWVTHGVHNGLSLLLMVRQGPVPLEPQTLTLGDWAWAAASLAGALILGRYLWLWRVPPSREDS